MVLVRRLSVVGSGGHNSIAGHWDVLDNHRSSDMRGDPDPCRAGTSTTADLKEVVRLSSGTLPGSSRVGADFEFVSSAFGVDDLSREPVLRNAALHVDLQVTADFGARNIIPGDVDNAGGRGCESGKSVGEKIEVVRTASWAFVDNLYPSSQYWRRHKS